jgi:gluconokinase
MGVSGSGKTTIGERLAAECDVPFCDADRLHPPANVAKMASGHALDDADRWPWLRTLVAWMDEHSTAPPHTAEAPPGSRLGIASVVGCSALKRSYRDVLRTAKTPVRFAYLRGDARTLTDRVTHRHGHFFPPRLLAAQLAILEEPGPDENPVVVSIGTSPDRIVTQILAALTHQTPAGS